MSDLKNKSIKLAMAIRQVESGGNYNAKGGSGESGAYQFMPTTWKSWAGKYLSDPNAEMTRANQNEVAVRRIADMVKQGYNEKQVASTWNSGSPEYEGKVGVNKYGVKYDVPSYVNKVASAYNQQKNMPTQQTKTFDQGVNEARQMGWSDTKILEHLREKYPTLSPKIDEMKQKATTTNRNDRDILNFMTQKIAGKMPTIESQPLEKPQQLQRGLVSRPQEKSVLEKTGDISNKLLGSLSQGALGVAKGGISTFLGASQLGQKAMEKITGVKSATPYAKEVVPKEYYTPEGTAQKIGFGMEQIAEFLAPSGAIAKAEKGLGLVPRMATEAGIVGGQRAMQKGDIDKDAKTAAIVAGLFPLAGAAWRGAKGIFKVGGEKIQQSVIKPTLRDIKDGFKIENVSKYNVGGNLPEMMTKTQQQLNKYTDDLQNVLKASDEKIDLNKIYQETENILLKAPQKIFGDVKATKRVLNNLKEEMAEVSDNGIVNLVEATNIKRGAGTKGAWSYGRFEPDASATEKVYNTFYNKIKTAIENAAPSGIKEINKKLSDLIPISNAILRRLPIEQRNNIISLTDSINLFGFMFDPKALFLYGAGKISKSAKFGSFLIKIANKKSKTAIGERIFGR